jgi:hypothetical protein
LCSLLTDFGPHRPLKRLREVEGKELLSLEMIENQALISKANAFDSFES